MFSILIEQNSDIENMICDCHKLIGVGTETMDIIMQ